jgi:hypothetical protein
MQDKHPTTVKNEKSRGSEGELKFFIIKKYAISLITKKIVKNQ